MDRNEIICFTRLFFAIVGGICFGFAFKNIWLAIGLIAGFIATEK